MAPGTHSPAVRPSPGSFWDMHLQSPSPSAGGSGTLRGRPARHARRLCTPASSLSGRSQSQRFSAGSCSAAPTGLSPEAPPAAPHHLEPLRLRSAVHSTRGALSWRWVTPAQALSTGLGVTCAGGPSRGPCKTAPSLSLVLQACMCRKPHARLPTWCLASYTGQAHAEPGGPLPNAHLP